jgi:hypothetical protein
MYAQLQTFGIGAKEARKLAYAPIAECAGPRGAIFERVDGVVETDKGDPVEKQNTLSG